MQTYLGGQFQAALLPAGLACVGLLLAGNIGAGCVDFVVALSLEVVEHPDVL